MGEQDDKADNEADPADQTGEDDGSTSIEGKDGHLKDDQKPTTK